MPPMLEHLFTMRLAVGVPQLVAEGLRIVPVTGGTLEGPSLSAEVLPGTAADWLRVDPDGTAHMDVRLTARTREGELLYVHYTGIRTGPREVLARLAAGEAVDPADYYFRIALRFETAAPRLAHLTRTLAIGTGARPPEGPIYEVFAVR
jgi:hypothetical protein